MGAEVKLTGFDVLAERLRAIVPALRKRVIRNALTAGARLVRDDARRRAPVLQRFASTPYRSPGTVKRAITVRTSKTARRAGDVGVFVNVKPAAGAKFKNGVQTRASRRGAKNPNDPFYWRFLEFGTRKMRARPFLAASAVQFPRVVAVFQEQVARWLNKVNQSGRVQP